MGDIRLSTPLRWGQQVRFSSWIQQLANDWVGRIHQGVDVETGDKVAIKIFRIGHNRAYLRELRSYQLLEGVAGVPCLRWSGSYRGRGVLVIDWLPADFGKIFQSLPESFTPAVIARLAEGVVSLLMHQSPVLVLIKTRSRSLSVYTRRASSMET
jgi:hypothetical protein